MVEASKLRKSPCQSELHMGRRRGQPPTFEFYDAYVRLFPMKAGSPCHGAYLCVEIVPLFRNGEIRNSHDPRCESG